MRVFIVSLVLFLVLVIALCLYAGFLRQESNALLAELGSLRSAVWAEDWKKAEAAMQKTENLLKKTTPRLALFTDHDILDEIMLTYAEAKGFFFYRETPEILSEIEALDALISHIPEREKLSLYNIF